ncbi:hypothetical protein ADK67_09035 [Saccharothrix sp. NRRL B-16348]|uniref:hypothetical protein n=1 Tax=Saccharothrix sp. NRRL B-16348 TaxID=1415542 RepID=UPI0006B0205B|nr:hypothetical protein [Saccharothrix sp. NRRL B-16348]KOX31024.1 hypothetical protein ADK67_09035 [Saccharothrix sp. NRRL B-16348]
MKVLTWLGLTVGLALTATWVAGGLAGDDVSAWLNGWLAGPIILLFVVPSLFSVDRLLGGGLAALTGGVPKQFRGAPIGMGTVVGVARTGLSVNDQPQLDIRLQVDTADGRTFPATARQVVDLTDLSVVQPGAILPVRYLPDGRAVLATDAPPHELQAALDRVQVAKGFLTPHQLRIAEQGVDASAVVLDMVPTGHTPDGRTALRLTLRVTRPDGTAFDVTQDKKLPPPSIPQVQRGMVVRVKYLPGDESDVAVLTTLM